jgi:23S rRNA pseudouridine2604 synthase
MRINKYLASSGVCSRRQADVLIAQGKVFINKVLAQMGSDVEATDVVTVDKKIIKLTKNLVYLAYYKPVGVICTADPKSPNNIIDSLNYPVRVFPVGRLDVASSGLIILTNDGDFAQKIAHPKFKQKKEYEAELSSPADEKLADRLLVGVRLTEGVAKADYVKKVTPTKYRLIIHQGWNRQVRRMFSELGSEIISLIRTRIGPIDLANLRPGQFRELKKNEVDELLRNNEK